jgi:hypothetical protein
MNAVSITTERTEYQPELDLAIALLPPVGRRYYWRVRACAEGICSAFSRPRWVNIGRVKCDYNADGYDDVAISAYALRPGGGALYFYYGGSDAQFGMKDDGVVFSPSGSNDGFGISLSCAGDVDGDGFADALVGAPYGNRAFVYRGSSSDRFASDYITLMGSSTVGELGPYVASAGDVNGDGFGDVIVGTSSRPMLTAYLYLGGSAELDAPIALDLGESVDDLGNAVARASSAGDVNGDGFSDVIVVYHTVDQDIVRVYLGNPGRGFEVTPRVSLVDPDGRPRFVSSFDAAGDVNGDGFGDVVVGDASVSRVYVYLGKSEGLESMPSMTLEGNDSFGVTVAAVGDVNGDGFDDIAVADRSPKVLLYLGAEGSAMGEPDAAVYRDAIEDRTGQRLGSPGDIDGDGYSDFTIAMAEDSVVYFYFGRPVVASPLVEDVLVSQAAGDREFGFAVAHR